MLLINNELPIKTFLGDRKLPFDGKEGIKYVAALTLTKKQPCWVQYKPITYHKKSRVY